MTKLLTLILALCLPALSCPAEDSTLSERAKEAVEADRLAHVQLMNDRLINKLPQFSMIGEVKKITSGTYSINGEQFSIGDGTRIQGQLKNGATIEVRGFIDPGKTKLANQITVFPDAPAEPPQAQAMEDPATMQSSDSPRPLPR